MPHPYGIASTEKNIKTAILPCENEELWNTLIGVLQDEITNFEQFSSTLQTLVKHAYNKQIEKIDFSVIKSYLSKQDNSEKFFTVQLPTIINLFKQMPELFQDHLSNQKRIPLLTQMLPNSVVLSRSQISSLLASQFLCISNPQLYKDQPFPNPNFFDLFMYFFLFFFLNFLFIHLIPF